MIRRFLWTGRAAWCRASGRPSRVRVDRRAVGAQHARMFVGDEAGGHAEVGGIDSDRIERTVLDRRDARVGLPVRIA
jgi:hypothetical protein